jgi:uncharacterized protein YgiM (DUF1202 family)
MPQSISIGMLVLGGVLLLVAITGGNFKIFGAEVDAAVSSSKVRLLSGALGVIFIFISLAQSKLAPQNNPADSSAPKQDAKTVTSSSKYAVVFDPPTNIRALPTTASDTLCSVTAKTAIRILGEEGNWYKTDVCDGKLGYIYSNQVKF